MRTKYLPLLMLAALSLACNKEASIDEPQVPSGETVTLNATIGAPQTKIHFTQDMGSYTDTRWEEGDCLWVRSDTQPYWENGERFEAGTISADGHSAAFTGRTRKDGKICAVYPYALVAPGSDNSLITLDVPAESPLVKGDCPAGLNAAAAFLADGSNNLSMKYLLGALKISLTGSGQKINRLEIVDNAANALWGKLTITPDYEAKDIAKLEMLNSDSKRNCAALTLEGEALGTQPLDCYFLLPEGSLASGFILKVYDADGNISLFSTSSTENAIVRGKVVKMPAVDMSAALPYDSGKFEKGSGTQADPYQIAGADDLITLSNKLNDAFQYEDYAGKYYRQTADIDMSGKAFSPIGSLVDKPFTGKYDGNGKKISNLSAQGASSDSPASGIFGYITDAEISGVIAENRINTGSFVRTGGIVGHAKNSSIKDCRLIGGTLSASANICSGIVAQMDGGLVSGCILSGAKIENANNYAAGIVGHAPSGGRIENCIVKDNSSITAPNEVGGIGGKLVGVEVVNCSIVESSVSTSDEDAGGIAGWFLSGKVESCTAEASNIKAGSNYAGGIVGLLEESEVSNCQVLRGNVVETVKNCAGGIIGYMKKVGASTLDGCTVKGESVVKGALNIGGICGWLDTGTIRGCLVTEKAKVSGSGDGVGGIVGRAIAKSGTSNLIDSCVVTGEVIVAGAYSVGGILGYAYPDAGGPVNVYNCSLLGATVHTTSCDTGADPAQGDCMSAGIVGRMRLSDSGSIGRVVNCVANVLPGGFPCDLPMAHPSIGAFIGYGHITATGKMEVLNCSTNMTEKDIVLAGNPISDLSPASQVGALFGKLPNSGVIVVSHNCYPVSGLGTGVTGEATVVDDNKAFSAAELSDGTACSWLNAYVAEGIAKWKQGSDGYPCLDL